VQAALAQIPEEERTAEQQTKREGPFRRAICATFATGGNRVALLQREGRHLESRCNAATLQHSNEYGSRSCPLPA
jgi:23S rRNA pseudoU1915 N3-methylase RlmH